MQLDLKNIKVTYTVKEIIAVLAVIAGIVGSYIRTEVANMTCQQQIVQLRLELDKCKPQVAQDHGGIPHN